MKKIVEIFLGIMTALGGFVEIGELVFMSQAGALFDYSLLWVVALGTVGITVFTEMCGRVAAVAHQPVFVTIRRRLPRSIAFTAWMSSSIVNVVTCAAEIGGIAWLMHLLFGQGATWTPLAVAAVIGASIVILPFKWIERVFGFAGLSMLVFFAATIAIGPDYGKAARDLLPNLPALEGRDALLYAYFAVGIISSVMMPYEVYFYSSGGIEEGWKPSDVPMNKAISTLGVVLGSTLAMAVLIAAAEIFGPRGIRPELAGSPAFLVGVPYGHLGFQLAVIGMITALAGAAVETALAGAYNVAQYFKLPWGRAKPVKDTPAFNGAWISILLVSAIICATGVDPVQIVELSVMAAVVCLPASYLAILLAARDERIMGEHVNSRVDDAFGWFFVGLVSLCAIAAPVLAIATKMGKY